MAPINNSTLLFIFYFIIVVHVFDSVKHLWSARTRETVQDDSATDGPTSVVHTKNMHRLTALWSIVLCLLCLPWVAYLNYIISEEDRRIPLPVLIFMAIYVIGLGVIGPLGKKLINEQ
ncbi:hypothetical protein IU433_14320 [Nocardia puris]|uniref:hypothetical protein n=1 Tax=Nocardia puris TaxID=208602 RepID=UPI0011BD4703|nr:hypothetical protein [Nocardia puris]MBF6214928.1 hypothetical protein [Nocardia puris]MBF6364772.1 hypothetical protein [Nocardia puris]MBF6460213.1 hypothetical protein [Nocardia puris]